VMLSLWMCPHLCHLTLRWQCLFVERLSLSFICGSTL
jgi:hypothetical protein